MSTTFMTSPSIFYTSESVTEGHPDKLCDQVSDAILANSGHFNVEINAVALEAMAASRRTLRPLVEEFRLADGRCLYLLAEGRLINLAAAEGHPASVMDMSFANQALCAAHLARLKLDSMGITIDELTDEQLKYLSSWEEGT